MTLALAGQEVRLGSWATGARGRPAGLMSGDPAAERGEGPSRRRPAPGRVPPGRRRAAALSGTVDTLSAAARARPRAARSGSSPWPPGAATSAASTRSARTRHCPSRRWRPRSVPERALVLDLLGQTYSVLRRPGRGRKHPVRAQRRSAPADQAGPRARAAARPAPARRRPEGASTSAPAACSPTGSPGWRGALIVVSHDRHLLDRAIYEIIDAARRPRR